MVFCTRALFLSIQLAMSLPSKKKSSRREDHRRLATYKVNNCQSARLRITSDQLSAFVRYIEGNDSCQFGIVRLCTLQLDTLHPNPNFPAEKSTLIRFAAKLGRDGIIASLIRGGADPTAFSCLCKAATSILSETSSDGVNGASELLSASVRKLLATIPSPLAVYIIRQIVLRRAKYVSLVTSIAHQKRQGEFWSKNEVTKNIPGTGMTCEECNPARCTNWERQIKHPPLCCGQCSLLVMEGCNHIICESCFWQCAVVWVPPIEVEGHMSGRGEDIVCPVCTPSKTSSDVDQFINECVEASYIPFRRISLHEVEASKLRFKALPESLSTLPQADSEEGKVSALTLSSIYAFIIITHSRHSKLHHSKYSHHLSVTVAFSLTSLPLVHQRHQGRQGVE
jgi:hypothetical protein